MFNPDDLGKRGIPIWTMVCCSGWGDVQPSTMMFTGTMISIYLVKFHRDLTRPQTPNGGLVREMGPLISGKSRLVKYYKYYNLGRYMVM